MVIRKKFIGLLVLCLIVSACTSAQKTSVVSYKAIGIALEHSGRVAKALVTDGTINAEEGQRLKQQYMQARDAYISAGNVLTAMIEAEDFREAGEYEKYIIEVGKALTIIDKVIEKYREGGTW